MEAFDFYSCLTFCLACNDHSRSFLLRPFDADCSKVFHFEISLSTCVFCLWRDFDLCHFCLLVNPLCLLLLGFPIHVSVFHVSVCGRLWLLRVCPGHVCCLFFQIGLLLFLNGLWGGLGVTFCDRPVLAVLPCFWPLGYLADLLSPSSWSSLGHAVFCFLGLIFVLHLVLTGCDSY